MFLSTDLCPRAYLLWAGARLRLPPRSESHDKRPASGRQSGALVSAHSFALGPAAVYVRAQRPAKAANKRRTETCRRHCRLGRARSHSRPNRAQLSIIAGRDWPPHTCYDLQPAHNANSNIVIAAISSKLTQNNSTIIGGQPSVPDGPSARQVNKGLLCKRAIAYD